MSYDKNGLGVAEMTFISVNYPDIFEELWKEMDISEAMALNNARIVIEYHNGGLL